MTALKVDCIVLFDFELLLPSIFVARVVNQGGKMNLTKIVLSVFLAGSLAGTATAQGVPAKEPAKEPVKAQKKESADTSSAKRDDYVSVKILIPKSKLPLSFTGTQEGMRIGLDPKESALLRSLTQGQGNKEELPFNCVKSIVKDCIDVCDNWPRGCRQICFTHPEIDCA